MINKKLLPYGFIEGDYNWVIEEPKEKYKTIEKLIEFDEEEILNAGALK